MIMKFQVTTSIGVAFSPNNGHEYEELFKKADFCLYVAKEKGRDRYVFSGMRYIKSLMRILLTRRIRYLMTAGRCAN